MLRATEVDVQPAGTSLCSYLRSGHPIVTASAEPGHIVRTTACAPHPPAQGQQTANRWMSSHSHALGCYLHTVCHALVRGCQLGVTHSTLLLQYVSQYVSHLSLGPCVSMQLGITGIHASLNGLVNEVPSPENHRTRLGGASSELSPPCPL